VVTTQQNPTPFEWTVARERAAALLADGEFTDQEVADEVGVSRWTLWSWRQHPEFAARVRQITERAGEELGRHAIARKLRRMAAYDRRWRALNRVIEGRAADPAMRGVPGGETGLLVRTVKVIGSGEAAREVEEYKLDAALLKELRELERQAAEEAGQWGTKHDVRGVAASGSVIPDLESLKKLPLDELMRIHRESLGLPAPGAGKGR
jgi:hypothetical protein